MPRSDGLVCRGSFQPPPWRSESAGGSPSAFRTARTLALLLVLGCTTENLPDLGIPPGDEGSLEGTWVGTQEVLGVEFVAQLHLQVEDGLLGGHLDLDTPRGEPGYRAAPENLCNLEPLRPDAEGRYEWRIGGFSYDAETDRLRANFAPDMLYDPAAVFWMERAAWVASYRDGEGGLRPLGCFPRPVPACANGVDDDDDGADDEADRSCCPLPGECLLFGNDESEAVRCRDLACLEQLGVYEEQVAPPTICEDGVDNDEDGLVDEADPDCVERGVEERRASTCDNRFDDDGNGLSDDEDPSCQLLGTELGGPCVDGRDNDGDGLTDLEEEDCRLVVFFDEAGDVVSGEDLADCDDGVDNDDDGLVDGDDCSIYARGGEAEPIDLVPPRYDYCDDGLDDDGDGRVDEDDPSCFYVLLPGQPESLSFGFEGPPPCANRIDDDGDGMADAVDPDCSDAHDLSESPGCANGLDDDLDGLVDLDDPGCTNADDEEAKPTCFDGVDNDGDGLVDADDPHCIGAIDQSEHAHCEDGIDNDGDGWIDAGDPGCASATDDSEGG